MRSRRRQFTLLLVLALVCVSPYAASGASQKSGITVAQQNAIVAAAKRELRIYGGRAPIPGVLVGDLGPRDQFCSPNRLQRSCKAHAA